MRAMVSLPRSLRRASALGGIIGAWLACGALSAAPALAVSPSPPAGAPAVESAPSSLVGLDPQLPASVVSASAAPGSRWKPEKAVYGTASTNDIAIKGAGGTTIRVNEIYPDDGVGSARQGTVPGAADDDAVRQGPGRLEQPGLGGVAVERSRDRRCRQLSGPARIHRGRRGRPRHRRLQRQLGTVRSRPAAGRDQGAQLGRASAALRRAGRDLRAVVPGDRPAAAGRGGRSELAVEGDLPDGQRQRHLPRHLVHGRPARLRVQRDLPGADRGRQHGQPGRRRGQRPGPAVRARRASRPTTSTAWPATTRRPPRTS